MSKINSANIQLGASFIIGKEQNEISQSEIELTLKTAQEEADKIIENTRQEAQQIIINAQSEAQQNIQELMEQAKQQGFEEGYKTGIEQGFNEGYNQISQDMLQKIEALNILVKASYDIKKQILTSAESEILELSLLLAEKLVKTKLEIEPSLILSILKSAISELKEKDEVRIFVNPELAAKFYEIIDELKSQISGIGHIKILEDRTVSPDGVIVESLDTRIDARLSTQIEELTRSLFEEYARKPVLDDVQIKAIELKGNKKTRTKA